jgi:hypothetical protein
MSTVTLVVVLLALALVLHSTAPRQARAQAALWARRSLTEVDRPALERELTARLRVGATGAAVGTLLGVVTLLAGGGPHAGDGPDGVADLAALVASTVVCAVAAEAVGVVRRTPTPAAVRTASLEPRTVHATAAERTAEPVLVALAVAATGLAGVMAADGAEGARGAVAAGVGALVVMAVCWEVRRRMVRHARVARDDSELAVATVAGEVSIDRFGENLVASGGVLVLTALLVPAVATGPGGLRTAAVVLGVLTLGTMATLVAARRGRHERVRA